MCNTTYTDNNQDLLHHLLDRVQQPLATINGTKICLHNSCKSTSSTQQALRNFNQQPATLLVVVADDHTVQCSDKLL
jgi:hypothetical protein